MNLLRRTDKPHGYCRQRFLVSVAEVLQDTDKPVFVFPSAPAGEQNAPAVTSIRTLAVGLEVGSGEAVSVRTGVGDSLATGWASEVGDCLATGTPLFQTSLPLLFTHVYLSPPLTFVDPTGLQVVPLLTAPKAGTGANAKTDTNTTNVSLVCLMAPQSIFRLRSSLNGISYSPSFLVSWDKQA